MKKSLSVFCVLLTFCLVFTGTGISASAVNDYYKINVAVHTKQEIADYAARNSFDLNAGDIYDESPSCSYPYTYGKLSTATLNNSLNILNTIRCCAGIQEVRLDPTYYNISQAACVVNAANGNLSHFPKQPDDMPDDFYNDGYTGASRSNLCMGYGSLSSSLVTAWTADGDKNNKDFLGHRRWILYPQMGITAFGAAQRYNSMYVWDYSNSNAAETGVAWPAQYTPVQLFMSNSPWSISFDADYYFGGVDTVPINITNTTVKLECLNDGKVWNFSQNSSDGELHIDRDGYGQPLCIIFNPNEKIDTSVGAQYRVTIDSPLGELSYTVEFFDLYNVDDTDTDTQTDTESDTDTDTQTDTESDTDTDTQTDTESDTDTDTKTDTESDTDTDTQTDTESDTDTDTQTDTNTDSDVDEKTLLGDVSGDNAVTAADSLLVLRHVVGLAELEDELLILADVNGNNKVGTADAYLIQRYAIGINMGYDIGKPVY